MISLVASGAVAHFCDPTRRSATFFPTRRHMPPSAAAGLVISLAGIDAWIEDVPRFELAVGMVGSDGTGCLQHRYVTSTVGDNDRSTEWNHGQRGWCRISTVEYLINPVIAICVRGGIEDHLRAGLRGDRGDGRPCLGNDNCPAWVREEEIDAASWLEPCSEFGEVTTVRVDRGSYSATERVRVRETRSVRPPDGAWFGVGGSR